MSIKFFIEQCATGCRNNFCLSLTIGTSYFNTNFFSVFELVLSCFGAQHCSIAMHHTNTYVVSYMQHCMQLQVLQIHNCALCNMQLKNSCSHTILNARLHCVNFANFALYFLYHYYLHCIVLHMQCLQRLLTRQGCCSNANLLMQQSKRICRCKMQLFPWYFHLPYHLPFFSLAIRPCTVEDSAFIFAVNCAMGSSPAAELLHSALFSLHPCYFGAYPLLFFSNLFRFTR